MGLVGKIRKAAKSLPKPVRVAAFPLNEARRAFEKTQAGRHFKRFYRSFNPFGALPSSASQYSAASSTGYVGNTGFRRMV